MMLIDMRTTASITSESAAGLANERANELLLASFTKLGMAQLQVQYLYTIHHPPHTLYTIY
jgi:hypothetical protein